MGIFDSLKNQFIEVIEWLDASNDTIAYRFPVANQEIKMGAKLIVRESQMAIFVNEGKIADVFSPGTYELSTQNLPILTKLKSWKYLFNSPFKAEVYFVNTKQFLNQKWGTSNPVLMRDKVFGMIRLRGYGIFSYKVNNPKTFLEEVFGTNSEFTIEGISNHLKKMIVSSLSDLIAESDIDAIDLSTKYDELSELGLKKLQTAFTNFGLELKTFVIENLSLPEEVEKSIDKRTSIGVFGDINEYTRVQAADAIGDAARNEGNGVVGAGVGLGVGAGIGQILGNAFGDMNKPSNNNGIPCPSCNTLNKEGAKFCTNCGKTLISNNNIKNCIKCNATMDINSKFCPECGAKQELNCPKCNSKISENTKFCPECGEKI
jgi:membrane protease subunit (stomatin/prohibitin family)